MRLRANVVLVVAVLFALAQMVVSATGSSPLSRPATVLTAIAHRLPSTTVARADNDSGGDNSGSDNSGSDNSGSDNSGSSDDSGSDNTGSDNSGSDNSGSDNSGSADNSGSDNSGSDNGSSDNSGSDNSGSSDNSGADNSGSDNGWPDNSGTDNSGSDNGGSSSDSGDNADTTSDTNPDVVIDNVEPSPPPPASAPAPAAPASTTQTQPNTAAPSAARPNVAPSPQTVTEVTAVTNGTDQMLALGVDRITVQLFAAMPTGLTVTLRMVDPLAYPAVSGIRAGDLIFQIEAKDASGTLLTTLPAEVNVTIHYTDMDVLGLNEANITLARLNPDLNQWETAPKLVADSVGNTVSASITNIGVLVVYVP